MKKMAFKMHLHKGKEEEYRKRHDEIPQELMALLKSAGISAYSIFLDHATGDLFAVMTVENDEHLKSLPQHPVMRQWWTFMKDIMDTNEDHSPVTTELKEVFHMD